MAASRDFRGFAFDPMRVRTAGRAVGRNAFSKLYAIENMLRVVIHSVLTIQVAVDWWDKTVDEPRRRKAERYRARYATKPWHGDPGAHGLYYMDFADLGEILRANAHLVRPVIPEIDALLVQVEQVREPRNIVCHMNWPTKTDTKRVDVLLHDVEAHVARLASAGKIPLLVPA